VADYPALKSTCASQKPNLAIPTICPILSGRICDADLSAVTETDAAFRGEQSEARGFVTPRLHPRGCSRSLRRQDGRRRKVSAGRHAHYYWRPIHCRNLPSLIYVVGAHELQRGIRRNKSVQVNERAMLPQERTRPVEVDSSACRFQALRGCVCLFRFPILLSSFSEGHLRRQQVAIALRSELMRSPSAWLPTRGS
jgi:hypothetical protein